jgi:hypothetical protein
MRSRTLRFLSAAALLLAATTGSHALERMTWIASYGNDQSATCGRAAPCRNFLVALGRTEEGGIITVMDAAQYGAVAVNKPIKIVGDGDDAVIMAGAGTGGITVTPPSTMPSP